MDEIAIKVSNLHKTFKLPHEKNTSLKGLFLNSFKGRRTYELHHVLKGISFEVKKGEFFGIVGRNGSGKSTLLKLLAGIYSPESGQVQINGGLTPFIELGVGFNPELTGRENVYLNGALLGFSRKEMVAMYDNIVEFAELEKFMDQKLKNYSSGMQVRLAFSISIQAKNDILLLDEVLAVGDLDFQNKCYEYFANLKKLRQTVILVTHEIEVVRRFCDRSLLLHNGEIKKQGSPEHIAQLYESLNLRAAEDRLESQNRKAKSVVEDGEGGATVINARTYNPKTEKSQQTFKPDEKIGINIEFDIQKPIVQPSLSFIIQDEMDEVVFATNNWDKKVITKSVAKGDRVVLDTIIDNIFTDGRYTITAAIESKDFIKVFHRVKYMHSFMIGGHSFKHARTHPDHKLIISYSHTEGPKKV